MPFAIRLPSGLAALLLPFLWGEVARRGQLLGDRVAGGGVRVTNGKNFSYPGYNELLTGRADDRRISDQRGPVNIRPMRS